MANQKAMCGSILVIVFLLGVSYTLYVKETTYFKHTRIAANFQNTQTGQVRARSNYFFQVLHFNVENEKLKLRGNFNGSDFEVNKTQTLIIGGLEKFINSVKPIIRQSNKLEKNTFPKQHYFNHGMRVTKDVNCLAIINGDKNELARADELDKTKPKVPYSAEWYTHLTSNCSKFIHDRGYIMDALTEEERNFSVAFSVIMYKDIEQSERLLRAIYRPQHWICFHVDSKTEQSIYKAMSNIASCFENVFILNKRYNVKWGTMTVLEPEIRCMEKMWNKSKTWKYFINLTGQEFPLRTNSELVQILQAYNGTNDITLSKSQAEYSHRWKSSAGIPPHGIVPRRGSVHITASRGFVDYVLHDRRAKDFLKWTTKTKIPDETFFASLNYNSILTVPGSYRALTDCNVSGDIETFSVTRFKQWGALPCAGKRVRNICIFGTGDLPLLASRRELFANKFHLDFKQYALDCIEELHYNHTRDEYLGKMQFDVRWYTQLGFVSNNNG